ncbi:MAG TPA: hypothetical protein VGS19_13275 [Streptosporangiaceae bacterium]|nr:hypothetical protein [Streptosporangiaceae bacterium]
MVHLNHRATGSSLAVVLTAGLAVAGTTAEAAPTAARSPAAHSPNPSPCANDLSAVGADSPTDAWAVGDYSKCSTTLPPRTLALHWNGTSWSQVPTPNPAFVDNLFGVSVLSPTNAWAVGVYGKSAATTTGLILHWNGTSWSRAKIPGKPQEFLNSVSALSPADVWAVGYYITKTDVFKTLALHWNGTVWSLVPSPNPSRPAEGADLMGVGAVTSNDVWAVGDAGQAHMVLHWNGSAWSRARVTDLGQFTTSCNGASARSRTDAWAVGVDGETPGVNDTYLVHWNGTKWSQVASPNPGGDHGLTNTYAVSADSVTDAWAVGYYSSRATGYIGVPLILHWNGSVWSQVPSPNPNHYPIGSRLNGVTAVTPADAWAVGLYHNSSGAQDTLILHWNGTVWSVV